MAVPISWMCPYVLLSLLSVSCVSAGGSRRKRERSLLQFSDCGVADKVINFNHVHASPHPIIVPGTLYVSMSGNLTSDLPRRLDVHLAIRKFIFGYPFQLPCLSNGVGSCTYDNVCNTLERYEEHGCPRSLRHLGVHCHCPFLAGRFNMKDVAVNIPKVHGFAGALLNGDYELELQVQEEDGKQLGCLLIRFSMKKRNRGWLFKI